MLDKLTMFEKKFSLGQILLLTGDFSLELGILFVSI